MFLYENFVNLALKIGATINITNSNITPYMYQGPKFIKLFCSFPVGPKRFKEDIFAKKPETEKDQEFQTTKKELTVRFPE